MGTQGDTPQIGKWTRTDPPGLETDRKGVESNPLINTDPLIATPAPGDVSAPMLSFFWQNTTKNEECRDADLDT